MKRFLITAVIAILFVPVVMIAVKANHATPETVINGTAPVHIPLGSGVADKTDGKEKARIQIALLLDTSGSMSGLIDQARSQLWKMVNDLARARKNGQMPDLELALYEYGNSGLAANKGYLRQITAFSRDLDKVSEDLFALTTNGGDEYCGWVIKDATKDLKWSESKEDLKVIFIAGNEGFNQGPVNFHNAVADAKKKNILVNTIYCGASEDPIALGWQEGSTLGQGSFMTINMSQQVVHVPTPFDEEIVEMNGRLNETYISFGTAGMAMQQRQIMQDSTAGVYGGANVVERAVSKSNGGYFNATWDLVDAYNADTSSIFEMKAKDLPDSLRTIGREELKAKIKNLNAERNKIQEEIRELNEKRLAFIAEERKKQGETETLDGVMKKTMRRQAEANAFTFF